MKATLNLCRNETTAQSQPLGRSCLLDVENLESESVHELCSRFLADRLLRLYLSSYGDDIFSNNPRTVFENKWLTCSGPPMPNISFILNHGTLIPHTREHRLNISPMYMEGSSSPQLRCPLPVTSGTSKMENIQYSTCGKFSWNKISKV